MHDVLCRAQDLLRQPIVTDVWNMEMGSGCRSGIILARTLQITHPLKCCYSQSRRGSFPNFWQAGSSFSETWPNSSSGRLRHCRSPDEGYTTPQQRTILWLAHELLRVRYFLNRRTYKLRRAVYWRGIHWLAWCDVFPYEATQIFLMWLKDGDEWECHTRMMKGEIVKDFLQN